MRCAVGSGTQPMTISMRIHGGYFQGLVVTRNFLDSSARHDEVYLSHLIFSLHHEIKLLQRVHSCELQPMRKGTNIYVRKKC